MKITRYILASFFGMAALATLPAADMYVATNGTGDGSSWENATSSLQGAIDAISDAYLTNTVWVSNGVYELGGLTNHPAGSTLTTRVVIAKKITVRSANNDPSKTIIKGAWNATTTNGPDAVRCVYITNNARLIGFTITNGATLGAELTSAHNTHSAGGVWCPYTTGARATLSNCVISGNACQYYGGGAYYGAFINCEFTGNRSLGGAGGAYGSYMSYCTLANNSAGAASGAGQSVTLSNCLVTCNRAGTDGGGTKDSTIYNSIISSNYAPGYAGGVYGGSTYNSLIAGNRANVGGGANPDNLYNCTVTRNLATGGGGGVRGGQHVELYRIRQFQRELGRWISGSHILYELLHNADHHGLGRRKYHQ